MVVATQRASVAAKRKLDGRPDRRHVGHRSGCVGDGWVGVVRGVGVLCMSICVVVESCAFEHLNSSCIYASHLGRYFRAVILCSEMYSTRSYDSRSPSPDRRHRHSISRSILRSRSSSRSRSRSRESSAENPGNNLYVTGLSTRVTRKELEKHFSSEGKVLDVHLVTDPWTKESRGFGFITMSCLEDAERSVKYLNRSVLEGRVITVEKGAVAQLLTLPLGEGPLGTRLPVRDPTPRTPDGIDHIPPTTPVRVIGHVQDRTLHIIADHLLVDTAHATITLLMSGIIGEAHVMNVLLKTGITGEADAGVTPGAVRLGVGAAQGVTLLGQVDDLGGQGVTPLGRGGAILGVSHQGQGGTVLRVYLGVPYEAFLIPPRSEKSRMIVVLREATQGEARPLDQGPSRNPSVHDRLLHLPKTVLFNIVVLLSFKVRRLSSVAFIRAFVVYSAFPRMLCGIMTFYDIPRLLAIVIDKQNTFCANLFVTSFLYRPRRR
ncbi:hypothetical protein KSS87_021722 [Heliosperma pusillum]|nr:hypothetical protein KSS87_021722 [Heliosperma pusillum]